MPRPLNTTHPTETPRQRDERERGELLTLTEPGLTEAVLAVDLEGLAASDGHQVKFEAVPAPKKTAKKKKAKR